MIEQLNIEQKKVEKYYIVSKKNSVKLNKYKILFILLLKIPKYEFLTISSCHGKWFLEEEKENDDN